MWSYLWIWTKKFARFKIYEDQCTKQDIDIILNVKMVNKNGMVD